MPDSTSPRARLLDELRAAAPTDNAARWLLRLLTGERVTAASAAPPEAERPEPRRRKEVAR